MNEIKPYGNLQEADLQEAYLQGANLRGANLQGAYLLDANLRDADLRETNLRVANLRGANLRGAYLLDADLQKTGVISGQLGPHWCIATPDGAWCGCQWQSRDEWLKMTDDKIKNMQSGASKARAIYGDVLRSMIKTAAAIGWAEHQG